MDAEAYEADQTRGGTRPDKEGLLEAILTSATDQIFVIDRTGRYLAVGQAGAEALGRTREQCLGRTSADLGLVPGTLAPLLAECEAVFVEGRPVEGETTRIGPTGEVRLYAHRLTPLFLHDGEIAAVTCMVRDMTDVHQAVGDAAEIDVLYQREHRIAESLQRSLLSRPPRLALTALEVETLYKPAWDEADVGGDYHDVFALAGGKVALVVGDVSGKGLEAASRTAEIKFTLRAYLREYPHAAPALHRLNAFLCEAQVLEETGSDYFVCLTVIVLDTETGAAQVAAGGAEPPLLLRAEGLLEEVRVSGLPLGVSLAAVYGAATVTLNPGDLLLTATDGITEARQGGEFLGWEGMTRLASAARQTGSLRAIGEAVLTGAQLFAGGQLKDDACLLLARRK